MVDESSIHRELAAFGPAIIDVLDSVNFFELQGEYNPTEIYTSIPKRAWNSYNAESDRKNSRVWDITKALIVSVGLAAGISLIKADYPRQAAKAPRKTAQDYQEQYVKEHGGEFITRMSRTDQKKLINFIWQNAGQNERPLARTILETEPQLAYLVDHNENRLRMIKRTEVGRATNYASQQFASDSWFTENTWHTAKDRRVRPSHRANDGITVGIGEKFPNGETYPGEISINCRCHLSYR